jgi:GNAT superfamily N-acetyltransferase
VKPPLLAPEPLSAAHDVSGFSNGVHPSLDAWLRERVRAREELSARTYVVCPTDAPARVVGYFSISTALEKRQALPSAKLRRGMPEEVPLLLIGRLAVDAAWRGRGLGSALLADALRRCLALLRLLAWEALWRMRLMRMRRGFTRRMALCGAPWGSG